MLARSTDFFIGGLRLTRKYSVSKAIETANLYLPPAFTWR
jgi:hypothetical protein